jgi:hypothetical protein
MLCWAVGLATGTNNPKLFAQLKQGYVCVNMGACTLTYTAGLDASNNPCDCLVTGGPNIGVCQQPSTRSCNPTLVAGVKCTGTALKVGSGCAAPVVPGGCTANAYSCR